MDLRFLIIGGVNLIIALVIIATKFNANILPSTRKIVLGYLAVSLVVTVIGALLD